MKTIAQLPIEILWSILAALGGAARYLQEYIKSGKFHAGILVANVLLSGFSGLMFALFGKTISLPDTWLFIFAGVGGFMGANSVEFIAAIIKRKIKDVH